MFTSFFVVRVVRTMTNHKLSNKSLDSLNVRKCYYYYCVRLLQCTQRLSRYCQAVYKICGENGGVQEVLHQIPS